MKINKVLILGAIILTLASCKNDIDKSNSKTDLNKIEDKIAETNSYLTNQNLNINLFGSILQSKLKNSLVYSVNNNQYLINYNSLYYSYDLNKIEETNSLEYKVVNTVIDALKEEVGVLVLTKGYYEDYDGGNALFEVCNYIDSKNSDELLISDENKSVTLKYLSYDSVINVYQLGYKNTETLDTYVNDFTGYLKYSTIYVPENTYKITNNFDAKVSNKVYCGYNAKIYADDSYSPIGYNNGCLFYVYNNVKNIQINGFDTEVKINKKLDDPLLGLLSARDVDGLEIANCRFYIPKEGSIYASSGLMDFFTNWKNVVVRNCYLENYSSTVAGGGIGFRDIYKKGCENALFENNYIYCNCKDEVIAIFSGNDTSLYPDDSGGGYIRNVVLKNNHIVGGKPNDNLGPRVVGLTVGYQISPVYEISYIDNEIEMYSANYFFLYGKADGVIFKGNNVKIDASYMDGIYVPFCHNSNADEGKNIVVDSNDISFINDSTAYTIANTNAEFSFINNKIVGKDIKYIFKSKSKFENNEIIFDSISKAVYHNVKETKNNNIKCNKIGVVFEFYNLNITDDIVVSDTIYAESIGSYMMMFNGEAIYANGHSVTFKDFIFDVKNVESQWYGLAYGTSSLMDNIVLNFQNADISLYADSKHNYVYKDEEKRVIINFN